MKEKQKLYSVKNNNYYKQEHSDLFLEKALTLMW